MSIPTPPIIGSYVPDDVTMLLTELSDPSLERPVEEREAAMQNGGHYSESLPIEYQPTAEYEALFERLLAGSAARIALLTQVLARRIVAEHHAQPVLVSLARAGTPVGVALRRALTRDGIDAPHYTVSIVRGRGLDRHALDYLAEQYPAERIVFVDGWTGKGAIQWELEEALREYRDAGGADFPATLAVLTDPAHVAQLCASREDELIPSACLNSTVSGLISRTVIRPDLLGPGAFHGVKVYHEFAGRDRSRAYVDAIAAEFDGNASAVDALLAGIPDLAPADGRGLREVQAVQAEHGIDDVHRVKPGIGETTRVLLRRMPDRILVDPRHADRLEHILVLARDRGVPIVERENDVYACFGLIADKSDGA
ncbi:Cysteine protease StiP [Paraconexibacter sp. AEG42_29]|uniref:Cysteine protease StiP n=1 Tax=Paraconexibacter sp. AEG42_29 TaxID=2997339 RepID=A0AAU7AWK0_9ACTN